ncbi:MAG TPA: NAD(P)(+) transhydrogenase (Re/Si-specific) subunit beta, partial [Gammaproteobacteria bacterium]
MNSGIITVSYLAASALFILALGGLSHQESARRGNWYGIVGMGLALLVTIVGLVTANYAFLACRATLDDPTKTVMLLTSTADRYSRRSRSFKKALERTPRAELMREVV